jgi:hypothetical protein
MRFHEQLKQPTTPAHDRACLEVMKLPAASVLVAFFPELIGVLLSDVTLKWFPEEPVREPHRGNLVGFIDLAAQLEWEASEEEKRYDEARGVWQKRSVPVGYRMRVGIEVKTSAESMGNSVRQVKTYRGGIVRCNQIPMSYGQVNLNAVPYGCRLTEVALALPEDEITEDVRLLATGVPLIGWGRDATAVAPGTRVGEEPAADGVLQ